LKPQTQNIQFHFTCFSKQEEEVEWEKEKERGKNTHDDDDDDEETRKGTDWSIIKIILTILFFE
jgi:hypothetical protein